MIRKFFAAAMLPTLLSVYVNAQQPITYVDADITAHTPDDPSTPMVDERMPGVITGNTSFAAIDVTRSNEWTVRDFGVGGNLLQASGANFGEISTTISGLDAGAEYNVYAFFWGTGANWFLDGSLQGPGAADSAFVRATRDDASSTGPVFEAATLSSTVGFTNLGVIEATNPLPLSRNTPGTTLTIELVEGRGGDLDDTNETNGSTGNTSNSDQNLYAVNLGTTSALASGEIAAYIRNIAGGDRVWYDGLGYQQFDNVTLTVDVGSGEATLGNRSAFSQTLDAYQLSSAAGSLDTSWNGVRDDVSNWDDNSSGASSNTLAEATDLDPNSNPLVLAEGVSFDLGTTFVPGSATDLEFTYLNDGVLRSGDIRYVLAGDYNDDGTVDAADYTVWRDNEGAVAGTLPNDFDGGVIGQAQYDTWAANYGATLNAASAAAIPEPATAGIAMLALSSFVFRRRA